MPAKRRSRFTVWISSISARDKSMLAGSRSGPIGVGSRISRESTSLMRQSYVVLSRSSGFRPDQTVRLAWGSMSTSSTRQPASCSAAPRLATVVVLATPPFWLATAITRLTSSRPRRGLGPCVVLRLLHLRLQRLLQRFPLVHQLVELGQRMFVRLHGLPGPLAVGVQARIGQGRLQGPLLRFPALDLLLHR